MPSYKKLLSGNKVSWYVKFYYIDWTGKRRQKKKSGFATRKKALEWERDFLTKQNAAADMNFAALADIYLEDCKSRLKATTMAQKQSIMNDKILPYFKDMPVRTITAAHVRNWQNTLLTQTYAKSPAEKHRAYSPTYLKTVNAQLSCFFNYVVKFYRLPVNPVHLAGSIGKQHADKMNFWTQREFSRFANAIADKILSFTAFNLLFWTGCRCGELLALTASDIDFAANTISINKSYARLKGHDIISPPKTTGSVRKIALPHFLADILRKYMEAKQPRPGERLFGVTKHYLRHEMARGCRLAGVRQIRLHDLRHSHASLLIELNCSPVLIKERLGHKNVQTTLQIYAHLYPDKQHEVAKKLQEIFDNNGL